MYLQKKAQEMFLRSRYSFLRQVRTYYTVHSKMVKQENQMAKQIYSKIKSTGPISVAEYMREVLVHPESGYYMHRDVFGETGDFVTSPELGQIFGEMVAVWFLHEWRKIGSPKPLQIVELGPGRGTLMQDILRVFNHYQSLNEASVHLVEVSPLLSKLQSDKLCMQSKAVEDKNSTFYREGITSQGNPIKWYRHLADVPNGFTILVAHEFFDALPIHKFKKTEQGYREIKIDIDPATDLQFRYVIAQEETPPSKFFIHKNEQRDHLEVSPESLSLVKDIATRLEEYGGLALIADYGHDGNGCDTFRAFKKHALHDPLVDPGTADLTADVDFNLLKMAAIADGKLLAFGPTTQRDFLLKMGIELRVKKLESSLRNDDERKNLQGCFEMMTSNDKMGSRFKFLALFPSVLKNLLRKVPVIGF